MEGHYDTDTRPTGCTVQSQGMPLQTAHVPHRFHYMKVTIRVHEYPGETLAVFHGPRCLAHYHADGQPIKPDTAPHRRRGSTQGSDHRPTVECRPTVNEGTHAHR